MVASPPRPAPPVTDRAPIGRAVAPRRGLPGARAVVGGLLIAVAAVGVFVAYEQATTGHTAHYVVAAHALQPGQRIRPGDLALRSVDLPRSLQALAYRQPALLRGAIVLGPIAADSLIQRGQVTTSAEHAGANLVSFSANRDRAVAGSLAAGDRIAVLVGGEGARARVVATDLNVVDVDSTGGGVSGGSRLVITVSANPDQAIGVAEATNPDDVTVVRSTGVAEGNRLTPDVPANESQRGE